MILINYENGSVLIPIGLTLIIFFIWHIILFLKFLVNRERVNSKFNILYAFLYLNILLKINYEYYNVFFSVLLVFFGFNYLIKTKKNNHRNIGFILLTISTTLLLTPDTTIFELKQNNVHFWNPKITWKSFQAKPDKNSVFDAHISTGFRGLHNKVCNYPPAILISVQYPKESWRKPAKDSSYDYLLLKHEQRHFDITEFHVRKAKDSVKKCWGKNSKEIENVIIHFNELMNNYQTFYDSITNHGLDTLAQLKFDKEILRELQR